MSKSNTNVAKKNVKTINPPAGRGRKKLVDTMTAEEIKQEVKEFLNDLAASSDPEEKKRIRRALRLRGHFGGLGEGNGGAGVTAKKIVKKDAKKAAPIGRRAKKAAPVGKVAPAPATPSPVPAAAA